jgi:hypothetical protein
MLRIYLDTSVYNRPFDNQTQPRIWLETLAFGVILQMIEAGDVDLVSSSVLEYENSRNPFPWRRSWVTHCNELAKLHQSVNVEIKQRAEELEQDGLKAMDALHVACAEGTESDYFLTCNDRIIQRYNGENLRVLNPVNFVLEVPGDE